MSISATINPSLQTEMSHYSSRQSLAFFKKIDIRELTDQKEIHTIRDDHLIFQ